MSERSVLHVLPHPGGGGETYVDLLDDMPGYRFERTFLAPSPRPSAVELARGLFGAYRRSRGYDLVHVHGDAAAILCLPILAARPSIVTFNGLHLTRRLRGFPYRAIVLCLHAVVRLADQTICVSRSELGYLRAAIGSASVRRVLVIQNGVHIPAEPSKVDRAAVRAELGLAESEPVGIWVGSLDDRKDPLAAIRAAEAVGLTLLVVGDGPLRERVERSASTSTRVLGQRGDVSRVLQAADIFVQTSHREGLAFALLEAMARGLVPVVTKLPENLEAVDEAGIVVASDRSLESALRGLAADPAERADLGGRARQRAKDLFGATKMMSQTRVAYEHMLAPVTRAQ